jgi:hypothetical protein
MLLVGSWLAAQTIGVFQSSALADEAPKLGLSGGQEPVCGTSEASGPSESDSFSSSSSDSASGSWTSDPSLVFVLLGPNDGEPLRLDSDGTTTGGSCDSSDASGRDADGRDEGPNDGEPLRFLELFTNYPSSAYVEVRVGSIPLLILPFRPASGFTTTDGFGGSSLRVSHLDGSTELYVVSVWLGHNALEALSVLAPTGCTLDDVTLTVTLYSERGNGVLASDTWNVDQDCGPRIELLPPNQESSSASGSQSTSSQPPGGGGSGSATPAGTPTGYPTTSPTGDASGSIPPLALRLHPRANDVYFVLLNSAFAESIQTSTPPTGAAANGYVTLLASGSLVTGVARDVVVRPSTWPAGYLVLWTHGPTGSWARSEICPVR